MPPPRTTWKMDRRHLEALLQTARAERIDPLSALLVGLEPSEVEEEAAPYEVIAGVAVIKLVGVIWEGAPRWAIAEGWATDPLDVRSAINQAADDPAVKAIWLYVDSPGGYTDGVDELADTVYEARSEKPVFAHVANLGASAAYEVASQASAISANRSASVGAIGVYAVLDDFSKAFEEAGIRTIVVRSGPYKGTGVYGAPIPDEELTPIQEQINGLAAQFVATVARGRNLDDEQIAQLATGRTWLAPAAVELGLIDRVATAEDAFLDAINVLKPSDVFQPLSEENTVKITELLKRMLHLAENADEEEQIDPDSAGTGEVEDVENTDADTATEESETYTCECIKCGYTMESEEHCADIKCPECGGQMRRAERPGPGQDTESEDDQESESEPAEAGVAQAPPSENEPDATELARDELQRYTAAVGAELAVQAITGGLTLSQAKDLRIKQLEATVATLREYAGRLEGEEAPVSAVDAPTPVDKTADKMTQRIGPNLAKFAAGMKLPGSDK